MRSHAALVWASASQGRAAPGSLLLPKQALADPAGASGALCQVEKPCQVDKPLVAWFRSALPAAHGLGTRRMSALVFLEQGPRCGSAQSDPSKSFIWTRILLPLSHFGLTCQFVPIPQVKSQFQSEALIWFSILVLRLRTGNSTLPLKAFFHLPCKAQQFPSSPTLSWKCIQGSVSKCIMVRFQPVQW